MVGIEAAQDRCGSLRGGGIACELVPARGEWDGSGIGECKEGLPGDMPGIRAPGEGPETCGETGHGPTLGLTDTIVYGELGSRVPCGLAKLEVCPIEMPREEGEGVGPKGEGARRAPLGELAAWMFPGDCVVIMDGEGGTWYGLGGDVRGG